ncbi:hypothetical protein GCM10007079_30280 [Nocardiopsis terrae]|uniref:Uncharacterized protein n=1 Tax=Nocardiopsis terrae TaxID=372655 RepID=A0ABR9HIK6_9ACTN|nr:hypothetical protein [Nocardiopsis terrae]MBE1458857.1 hypothetical protein [Nocardiopsis terrae]GHC86750.1 hypothetical protein GCM10007079_30280 [Nocardiopsis terrae]
MIALERTRPSIPFPRWPGAITPPEPAPSTTFADLRRQGWTLWFGRHTRQYWAAHTRSMRLVCADTPEELLGLLRAIT